MEETRPSADPVSSATSSVPDRTTLIAFLTFVLIGGSVAISVRFIYSELAPFWSGALRFTFAALIFWVLMLIFRTRFPKGQALLGAVLFGLLSGTAILSGYYGLVKTQASLYQTLAATMPLATLLLAALHRLEPMSRRGIAGSLLAIIGIVIAVSGSLSSGVNISWPHILAVLFGIACLAEGGIVIKLFPPSHPYATNAVAMTIAAAILLLGSLMMGEVRSFPTQTSTWLAMAYLILVATVGLFLLYLFVLKRWTATGASYAFVLAPIVVVVLASLFTDETISLAFLAGAVVVIAGVYVGALMPKKERSASVEDTAQAAVVNAIAASEKNEEPGTEPVTDDIQVRPGLPNCI
jgi:drug/metabolite transporter (DMT)-like permease